MKLPFGSWHGKCFQCLSFLETLSPVKVLSFPTPRFLNGGCSRARAVPTPRADKRSAATAPMHAGGSGPCGIADGARAIHRRSWPQHTRPRGSRRSALPHQRATAALPTPPGFGARLRGSSGSRQPFKLQLHQTFPNAAPAVPDLISSSTSQIRFNASPSRLLTLPSRQDLPPLPGPPVHPEQNSSPGGSCKLCCTSEIPQYSFQTQNSAF